MLAPRSPSAFVCLRCEHRLARLRLPTFTRRTPHANFSASLRRHDGADDLEALSRPQQSGPKITREVQPLDRLRKRKGKVIRETSAKLGGLKQLGGDADILVLKEIGDLTPEEPDVEPGIFESPEVPDILAALEEEGNALTPDEIYQQIESLRPKTHANPNEPHYVTQTTFLKLIKVLNTGFRHKQLQAFYSVAKNIQQGKVFKEVLDGLKAKGTAKRPVERSEWQPGTTNISWRLPGTDVHVRGKRQSVSKQLLADRIMRDVWKLVLMEEVEAPGEIELSLKPWQVALLSAGENETPLIKIGRARRAKVEIFHDHSVLRITADKNAAEYAANDVEEALQNTEAITLNLKPWVPLLADGKVPKDGKLASLYTQSDLDTVTTLTRTSIEEAGDNMLLLRGLDKTAVNEAERTLIKLLPLKDSSTRTIDTQKLDTAKASSYLLPVFLEENSLDHKFRNMELGRRSLPVARPFDPEIADDQAQQVEVVGEPVKTPKTFHGLMNRAVATLKRPVDDTDKHTKEVGHWLPEPEYRLTAELGQVLFPLEHTDPDKAADAVLSQSSQSPFLSTIPGLSSLLTLPEFSATSSNQTPSLLYDFVPAPAQPNFEVDQMFPSLHVQMRAGLNGGKASLHKLSLGFQEHVHDVLFPDKAADVRFLRYGRLRLNRYHNDKSVKEWTDAVIKNIESGGRLTAPPLRLKIPKWTIPGYPADATGTRTVTYLFSGIQFRQSVTSNFLGTIVTYSTMQSGKLGAKGGTLTAQYIPNSDDRDVNLHDEISLKTFVKRCFGMVDKITEAAAQTLPVSRVLNPRNEASERKMKRAAQQQNTTFKTGPVASKARTKFPYMDNGNRQVLGQEQEQSEQQAANEEVRDEAATLDGEEPMSSASQHTAAEDVGDPDLANVLTSNEPEETPSVESPTTEGQNEPAITKDDGTQSLKPSA